MNILFVTPRIPYPPDTGAKIRTWNLLKQIKNKGNNVTLLSFIYKKEMQTTLVEFLSKNQIDLIHFDHLHLAQYAPLCNGIPYIIDEHNVESIILKRYMNNERNVIKRLFIKGEYKKMLRFERLYSHKAERVCVVSEKDGESLRIICDGRVNLEIIPNGVDLTYFTPNSTRISEDKSIILFVGSMNWLPNVDGVIYFCKEILPLIWRANPHVYFKIVGKHPPSKVRRLAKGDRRIIIEGYVDDIRPFFREAEVFVVPLRIGGGTRLKILEALAMEKPVVSTSIGAEGLNLISNQHLLIADEPLDFAESIITLLRNKNLARHLGKVGRKVIEEKFGWGIIGEKLNEVYKKVVNNV